MKNLKNLILILILLLAIALVESNAQNNLENAGSIVEISKGKAPKKVHSPRYSPDSQKRVVGKNLILIKGTYNPDIGYIWKFPEEKNNLEVKKVNPSNYLISYDSRELRERIKKNDLTIFTCKDFQKTKYLRTENASRNFFQGEQIYVIVYYYSDNFPETKEKFTLTLEFSNFQEKKVISQEFELKRSSVMSKNYIQIPLYQNLPPNTYNLSVDFGNLNQKEIFQVF